jgi:hypothetical protein
MMREDDMPRNRSLITVEEYLNSDRFTELSELVQDLQKFLFEKMSEKNMNFKVNLRRDAISLAKVSGNDDDFGNIVTLWSRRPSLSIQIGARRETQKSHTSPNSIDPQLIDDIWEYYRSL